MPFTLPNLKSNDVTVRSPWELDPSTFNYPPKGFKDSHAYKAWARQEGTRYCAFSLVEGEIANQRCTSSNEPTKIHGVVADYDPARPFRDTDYQSFLEKSLDCDHPCAYASRSYSGGIHALWFFEEPIAVTGMEAATEFLKKASKELGLRSLAAGLDKAVSKPTQYYLYGRDWQIVSQHVIPSTFTWAWMHASTKASTFNNYGEPIPLADVFTEIEARFPGVWTGDFREGARGPTFWDPHGGHKSIDSAVVRENGMQVFNMEKGFYSWSEILGHK
ncbi:MAG: hypothetical protein VXB01_13415, partial [Opitutae bacterium]